MHTSVFSCGKSTAKCNFVIFVMAWYWLNTTEIKSQNVGRDFWRTKTKRYMKSNIKLLIFTIFISNLTFGQKVCNEFYYKKFTKSELVADIEFIKEKILNAHINPFTEISKEEFEKNIIQIENSLKDGMTQKDFYFLAKPIFVKLNDEHSGLNDFCITDSIKNNLKLVFSYIPRL